MSRIFFVQICFLFLYSRVETSDEVKNDKTETVDCSTLRLGQYICPHPQKDQIDPDTQQFRGCMKGKEIPSEGEADGEIYMIPLYKLEFYIIYLKEIVI